MGILVKNCTLDAENRVHSRSLADFPSLQKKAITFQVAYRLVPTKLIRFPIDSDPLSPERNPVYSLSFFHFPALPSAPLPLVHAVSVCPALKARQATGCLQVFLRPLCRLSPPSPPGYSAAYDQRKQGYSAYLNRSRCLPIPALCRRRQTPARPL